MIVGMGRILHPNAAAGIEAGLSLFFSDEKLNLEGEKRILSGKYSTVLLKYFTPPRQAQAAARERVDSPTSLLRHQETEGAITAERQRQLEQASRGGWQQQSLVSLPEVQGVKGLALKKSLTSYWRY